MIPTIPFYSVPALESLAIIDLPSLRFSRYLKAFLIHAHVVRHRVEAPVRAEGVTHRLGSERARNDPGNPEPREAMARRDLHQPR